MVLSWPHIISSHVQLLRTQLRLRKARRVLCASLSPLEVSVLRAVPLPGAGLPHLPDQGLWWALSLPGPPSQCRPGTRSTPKATKRPAHVFPLSGITVHGPMSSGLKSRVSYILCVCGLLLFQAERVALVPVTLSWVEMG